MDLLYPDAKNIARQFLGSDAIESTFGSGTDGIVFSTTRSSAIKIYRRHDLYAQELAAYRRLTEHHVERICGHAVPDFLGHDDKLHVIEMSYVQPPYVLDFAKTRLDVPPDFTPEAWEYWYKDREEVFGENWPTALNIYNQLNERWGIFYLDLKPDNVAFAGDEES